jgi:HTH-type transcriptional regulator, competence development regulator
MTELGDLLRKARSDKKLTLRQVETQTGIPNAHLSQVETGRIEKPSQSVLWNLSEIYELDYAELTVMAGHVETASTQQRQSVLLRATQDLDQNEVLELLEALKKKRQQNPA